MKQKNKTVLVALSGGVDSSVAAMLLKKQGYNVIAVFMKNWSNSKNNIGECNWKEERRYAAKVAAMLNIPLITLDYEKEYRKYVVEEMFRKYQQGITPNPDIDCNEKIKFPMLLKALKKIKADYLITGHYVQKRFNKKTKKFELYRGKDESKDQSYFLYRIKQSELSRVLFPIGEYTKKEIREIAARTRFPNADKKSTVGICFIGKVNLKQFLQQKIKPKKGKILDPEGKIVGEHDGVYYYTIGQRIGPRFGIEVNKSQDNPHFTKKWYVAKKDVKTNTIIAAPEGHEILYRKIMVLKDFYLIDENKEKFKNKKTRLHARIRQVGELLPAELEYKNKSWILTLNKAITGVSEGQAVVLYKGEKVMGGGIIDF